MVNSIIAPVRDLQGQLMAEQVLLNGINSFSSTFNPIMVNWTANKQMKKVTAISLKLLTQVCMDAIKVANRRKLIEKIERREVRRLSEVISLVNSGVLTINGIY